MEWRKCYLDVILVPSALLISIAYHLYLWLTVRSHPHRTTIGVNASVRLYWVNAMLDVHTYTNPSYYIYILWSDLVFEFFFIFINAWSIMKTILIINKKKLSLLNVDLYVKFMISP